MATSAILVSIIIGLIMTLLFLIRKFLIQKEEILNYQKRYSDLTNIDEEARKRKTSLELDKIELQSDIFDLEGQLERLKNKYLKASDIYKSLVKENDLLEESIEMANVGIYTTHFNFKTSKIFREEIKKVKQLQRKFIKDNKAIIGGEGWRLNGNLQRGKITIERIKKLMILAFNMECNYFISIVKWNNITKIEERIGKSYISINQYGESQGVSINPDYQEIRRKELRLTYEMKLKDREEREAKRIINARRKEEAKVKRDIEKAQREERLVQEAIQKAQAQLIKAKEDEKIKYEEQVESLKVQLLLSKERSQRAISMAQQTKVGHVYVISNVGAFGEDVYKIGISRRLDPFERIKELGNASVPFRFDVHAMIFSEDAPSLEYKLHKAFEKYRMNYVNRYREYFKMPLEEIERFIQENHGEIEFNYEAEAREYRESKLIREQINAMKLDNTDASPFPSVKDLFEN